MSYLEIFLSVEYDRLGLDFSVLDVDLVASEDDGDIFAYSGEISVPVGHVFVSHTGGDVEHDDRALSCK